MDKIRLGILPYGLCECAVKDCWQRVQDHHEYDKRGEKSMCYCHAKCRDDLFGRPWEYTSDRQRYQHTYDWDLALGVE